MQFACFSACVAREVRSVRVLSVLLTCCDAKSAVALFYLSLEEATIHPLSSLTLHAYVDSIL